MQSQFVDVYRHMRDNAKPVTQQDAADLAKVREPQPPSRAHLKRLARGGIGKVSQPRPYGEPSETTKIARQQLDFIKMLDAMAGGTRTVASVPGIVNDEFFTFIKSGKVSQKSE